LTENKTLITVQSVQEHIYFCSELLSLTQLTAITNALRHNHSVFLRATAGTAIARLSHRNSVRPSVRPSHGWIRQKRCKL